MGGRVVEGGSLEKRRPPDCVDTRKTGFLAKIPRYGVFLRPWALIQNPSHPYLSLFAGVITPAGAIEEFRGPRRLNSSG